MHPLARLLFLAWALTVATAPLIACAKRAWAYEPSGTLLRPRTTVESSIRYLEEDRQPRILGVFDTSDHRFDEFISPQTNPIFFEDPRSLTEARLLYLHNSVANGLGAPGDFDYFG